MLSIQCPLNSLVKGHQSNHTSKYTLVNNYRHPMPPAYLCIEEYAPCLPLHRRVCPLPTSASKSIPPAYLCIKEYAPCLPLHRRVCPLPTSALKSMPLAYLCIKEYAPCLHLHLRVCPLPTSASKSMFSGRRLR